MNEVFEKIIGFIHSEIARTTSYAEHDTLINVKFFVEGLAEEHNNGWIACSERFPEEAVMVLVYDSKYDVIDVAEYLAPHWYNRWAKLDEEIVAWMPIPPKYEPKGE